MSRETGVLSNACIEPGETLVLEPLAARNITDHLPEYDDHILSDELLKTGIRSVRVGDVPDPGVFSSTLSEVFFKGANITALPIKPFGSNECRIPKELSHLKKTIQFIMDDQFTRCPMAHYKQALLFFSRSLVLEGEIQRTPGWHRDSARIESSSDLTSRNIPAHIYIVSDHAPTMIQEKPLKDRFNMFAKAMAQDPAHAGVVRQLKPYEIALMNNYVWHRAMPATHPGWRSFIAVMFAPSRNMELALRPTLRTPLPRNVQDRKL